MARDNFIAKIIEKVAKRAGYRCSRCGRDTIGPSTKNSRGHDHIGVASHITAAAPGGPRFNSKLTPAERSSIDNAIYFCQNCAKLIDSNKGIDFSVAQLKKMKKSCEKAARERLRNPANQQKVKNLLFHSGINALGAREKAFQLLGLFSEEAAKHLVSQVKNPLRANIQKDCPDVKRYVESKFMAFGECLQEEYAIELSNDLKQVREVLNSFITSKDEKKFLGDWDKIGKDLSSRCYFDQYQH